jgi:hypothetical protein
MCSSIATGYRSPFLCVSRPKAVEHLLTGAGFREVRVDQQTREDVIGSFDKYWDAIEAGTGSLPQLYLSLSEADRRLVRDEVRARLSQFETNGRLSMSVEMLVGSGRA